MGEEEYLYISITICPCIKTSYVFVTMLGCVLGASLSWKLFVCLFYLQMFLHCCFWSIFYYTLCQNSKNTQKVENPKSLIDIIVFCHKHILPCTFVLMALCIYKHSLFPMHSYQYGRNLDISVIVVNKFSNFPWMISQWFCWSWDMHRLVSIYFLILLFSCFCLRAQQM